MHIYIVKNCAGWIIQLFTLKEISCRCELRIKSYNIYYSSMHFGLHTIVYAVLQCHIIFF